MTRAVLALPRRHGPSSIAHTEDCLCLDLDDLYATIVPTSQTDVVWKFFRFALWTFDQRFEF